MAWSTPLTAVASTALTAAQWNASVRDNLLETPAAKATTAGTHFASTGANAIAERFILEAVVDTLETTTSTAYTTLATAGPTVANITTGQKALVWLNASMSNNTASQSSVASFAVSGATTDASADARGLYHDSPTANLSVRSGVCILQPLTPGVNTFTTQYRVQGGTGTFLRRRLQVMAL
jgi:hypothetical protein